MTGDAHVRVPRMNRATTNRWTRAGAEAHTREPQPRRQLGYGPRRVLRLTLTGTRLRVSVGIAPTSPYETLDTIEPRANERNRGAYVSDRVGSALASSDANDLFNMGDPQLAIADLARVRGSEDGFDR